MSIVSGPKRTRKTAVHLPLYVHSSDSIPRVYPEVRASVPPTDDETLPASTFRAWFLGITLTLVVNGLNQFFLLHNPPRKSPLSHRYDGMIDG